MITLQGIPRQHGVAIAVAATVNSVSGINGVSPALLESGISSLRKGLIPADYPEAIVACDNLAVGFGIKIPGIRTIGLAAESDQDIPGLPVETPCVIGLECLLASISEENILIVDGYQGLVHIDPDPLTLVHYQEAEELRGRREKVFITSEHLPARTQTGEIVSVYALVSDEAQMMNALDNGADGLVVDLRENHANSHMACQVALQSAAGKPVLFIIDFGCEDILRAAMLYSAPNQVMLVSDNPDFLTSQMDNAMDAIVLEALRLDIEPPEVGIGRITPDEILDLAGRSLITLVGNRIDTLAELVRSGVRSVAVEPEAIENTKYIIRSIGLEDEV